MKMNRACVVVLAGAVVANGDDAQVTPVQKVISLLTNMLAKGKDEKHAEQVQFAAYKQFCDDTTVEKHRSITEADEAIEMLKADIQKAISDAAQLGLEIQEHDADIATWGGDKKAASKVRAIEKTDYDATHKDYSESVDAIARAIQVLKKQAADRPQAESFAELSALSKLPFIPVEAKRTIDSFLEQDPETALSVSAPEANGYEFQSSGIVQMLEKLRDKFIDERTSMEKEETNARHAFEMLIQDLTQQIEQATADRSLKSETKAKTLQAKATAEGDLQDTSTTRAADHKYVSDVTATCEQKASDFEQRQQLRGEEIQALNKAIEILSSGTVSGAAEKHLPGSFYQQKKGSFAQLRAVQEGDNKARALAFLREKATQLDSRILTALAVRAADDPFGKVKKMLKDLIVRLMEEANEEAEHKGWCDTELSTNEQTRKEKTEAVETLHAEIDQLQSQIAKLGEELSDLAKAISQLTTAMATATKIRQEEKATNTATIKDAQQAQAAVAQALVVLREFYAQAAESTALLQQQHSQEPAVFDSPYQGMGAESGGVVGMLEVIESDFARLEADTTATEETSQREYDEFMTDSKVDNAQKRVDTEHKTAKKQDQTQALTTKRSDLAGTQKELDAALAYFDKLKPSCVDTGMSYEDRVSRRKEEIQSLQEALRILNGEDIA